MVLPLLKVGSLFIKSLAKPFSKQIKIVASKSPRFHASVLSGDSTRKAAQLNVNSAIDLGSEMASEFFLLSVAVGLLLFENKRSADKDKKKEETLNAKFNSLEENIRAQSDEIDLLRKQIDLLYGENNVLKGKIIESALSPSSSSSTLSSSTDNNKVY
ncbi:optic atrophy 3-like family protein [Heterostelium album PN500]|uniref:Optic atrophy 3-like family protein n=1 Tax=Heterostelium pallidum (strain ATCC 26659 / Pp 5 / PN500) TaxID=670386 RepID=D3BHG7_HETP5|nr:optic atrophy 3-like family protein [Heterostelium album PN500]EFA79144.1 optic atrophy 3-like family protein [Heterostelium album PN500]|eukprot:XP_020431266.1 optic atrophy 3-like family protein [Heterostelium album PN500]